MGEKPKIQDVLCSFFREDNDIAHSSNWAGGWGRLNSLKWNTKMIEIQGPNLGSHWTFLVLTAFQTEDKRYWPALLTPIQESHDQPMVPKHHSRLTNKMIGSLFEGSVVNLQPVPSEVRTSRVCHQGGFIRKLKQPSPEPSLYNY